MALVDFDYATVLKRRAYEQFFTDL